MKSWKIITVIIVVILIIIAGWCFLYCKVTEKDENGDIIELDLNVENYPRVDGSTSTHPLDVLIACKLLNVSYYWDTYWWDGTNRLVPNSSEPGKEHIAENISQKVIHHGTHGSYVNLIENKTDLILVARQPSEDELTLADSLGVELEIKAVALDAFVFILNINNTVKSLTIKQIQDIYTGKIDNWSEVGGNKSDINPYQRDPNSGSQELMESLVMKDLEMMDAPNMVLYGMMGPINRLDWDENGIGYSVYFFEEFMAPNENLTLCGVNGIIPNYENIKTKAYPFTTEVYVVIRSDLDKDATAYQLRDWLLTKEGQDVVKESGYVPIM